MSTEPYILHQVADLQRRAERNRPWIAALYRTATAQAFAHNTVTVLNADTKVHDDYNMVTTGAAWAARLPVHGVYLVQAMCVWEASADWAVLEAARMWVYLNGVGYLSMARVEGVSAGGQMGLSGSALVRGTAGDLVDVRVRQRSGAAIALDGDALDNWVALHLVRCV